MSALGFEPRTDRLKADRSTAELRTQLLYIIVVKIKKCLDWGRGNRTLVCWYQKPVPYLLAIPQK